MKSLSAIGLTNDLIADLYMKKGECMMTKGIIRPLVICIFKRDDTILVAEGYDSVKDDYYYRPIGGGN